MASRVSFSGQNLTPVQAAAYYNDVESSLKLYYSVSSPLYASRFIGYKTSEVVEELKDRTDELDRSSSMSILASIEASFRVDYLNRCYRKEKDAVSRAFREIYKEKEIRVRLDEDILDVWKENIIGSNSIIGELKSAFRFRHWMAHGRYWTPKHSGKFDYFTMYSLMTQTIATFPLIS